MKISLKLSAAIIAGAMVFTPAAQAEDIPEVAVVHQIIDLNADTPAHAFRFEPKMLHVPAGSTVRFKGSTGRHTVTSIIRMIPVGARAFKFAANPRWTLPLTKRASTASVAACMGGMAW